MLVRLNDADIKQMRKENRINGPAYSEELKIGYNEPHEILFFVLSEVLRIQQFSVQNRFYRTVGRHAHRYECNAVHEKLTDHDDIVGFRGRIEYYRL